MLIKDCNRGDVIFKEGSEGMCMYRIIEGSVGVYVAFDSGAGADEAAEAQAADTLEAVIQEEGTEEAGTQEAEAPELEGQKLLTVLGKGAIFGEMSILEGWPRSATIVVASDHTRLVEITRFEMNRFFGEEPEKVLLVMRNLSHRIRGLTEDYVEVCRTIKEMEDTRFNLGKRTKEFFAKLARFLGVHKRVSGYEKELGVRGQDVTYTGASKEVVHARSFQKGEILFRQGEEGSCMYHIESGVVGIYSGYGTAQEKQLTLLDEGKYFGEMGMIENLPRSADAVIMKDDTKLTLITQDDMEMLFQVAPELVIGCMQHLSSRLRGLTGDYLEACRILARMKEEEEALAPLSEEDIAEAKRYINIAMSEMPLYCTLVYPTALQ